MTHTSSSLTDAWSGVFRYPDNAYPETAFSAQIEDRAGTIVGSIYEPNVLNIVPFEAFLRATLEGIRVERSISFVKHYTHDNLTYAVQYKGHADSPLTRIEGTWTIEGSWSGAFFMTRDDTGIANGAD